VNNTYRQNVLPYTWEHSLVNKGERNEKSNLFYNIVLYEYNALFMRGAFRQYLLRCAMVGNSCSGYYFLSRGFLYRREDNLKEKVYLPVMRTYISSQMVEKHVFSTYKQ
jgi:hypothetical protein